MIRLFGWRLNQVKLDEMESEELEGIGITDETLKSYLAWRCSVLLFSSTMILVQFIFQLLDTRDIESDPENELFWELWNSGGRALLLYIGPLATFVLFCTGGMSSYTWTNLKKSSRIIKIGVIASSVIPIIGAFIPLKQLLGPTGLNEDDESYLQWLFAMEYLAKALVLVFSVTSALVAGSLRTRGLLPNSIHCVGYLVTIAPILSLMVFLFVSALVQIKGDKFLTLGAVCRFLAPLVYVFRREDYLGKSSDDTEKKIDFNQKIVLSLNLTGLALIVLYV